MIQKIKLNPFPTIPTDRFEAEISKATGPSGSTASNPFIPSQVRTVIGSQTYNQVQQKLATVPNRIPPPPVPPYLPTYSTPIPQQHAAAPEKSYSTEPTPAVVSSAPKLYNARPTVGTLPKVETSTASSSIGPTISSTPVQSVRFLWLDR